MNVSLTPKLEKMVRQKVKSGMYTSASEVIREGLRCLDARDRARAEKLEELRAEIAKGVRDLEEGRYIELDEEGLRRFFEDIKARGRGRLEAVGRKRG